MTTPYYHSCLDDYSFKSVLLDIILHRVDTLTLARAADIQDDRGFLCIAILKGANPAKLDAAADEAFRQLIVDMTNQLPENKKEGEG